MDINTEVRHGDTARCCVLTAAVTECSLSAPPPCLRRDRSQRAAAGGEEWTEQVCRGPGAGLLTLWTLWTLSAPSKSVFRLTLHCGKWWPAVSCDAR